MRAGRFQSEPAADGPYRRAFACVCLVIGFGIIIGRLFFLQVVETDKMAERARRQHERVVTVDSSRGAILDRLGRPLALNLDVPSVFAVPSIIENPRAVAKKLAPLVNAEPANLRNQLQGKREFVWVKRKMNAQNAKRIEELSIPGINILMEKHRFYPKGALLAHVLGFAGIDSQGLEGLERGYESKLRGEARRVVLQRDGRGRGIFPETRWGDSVLSGQGIQLTIDEVIQFIAEQALESAVVRTHARGGAILIMDPKTGEILAWTLRPTFDPNQLHLATPDLWRNRAVTDPYEPGSTLKTVVAAAALQEGIVEPDTLIYAGDGELPIHGTIIHDHEKSGWLTFREGILRSSNVATVKTGLALGKERYFQYLRAFGFGEKTEIDLPGESVGLVKPLKEWGPRTLASMSIGQEIAVTPLQLLTAVSAIANHGWLMKPYVVDNFRNSQGEVVWEQTPQIRRRPITEKTASTLTDLLIGVVEKGTGKRAAIAGYRVAGKTGTAQKVDPSTGTYSSTQLIGSFVGFVPAEDPQISVLVMIDEPQGPAWGGVVAAPVFREVASQVLQYLKVPPDQAEEVRIAAVSDIGSFVKQSK